MGFYSSQPGQMLMRVGNVEVRYYMREPSPDHWNAVGLIMGPKPADYAGSTTSPPMIVGVGATRDEAIGDLIARVLGGDYPDLFQRETLPASHPHNADPINREQ